MRKKAAAGTSHAESMVKHVHMWLRFLEDATGRRLYFRCVCGALGFAGRNRYAQSPSSAVRTLRRAPGVADVTNYNCPASGTHVSRWKADEDAIANTREPKWLSPGVGADGRRDDDYTLEAPPAHDAARA